MKKKQPQLRILPMIRGKWCKYFSAFAPSHVKKYQMRRESNYLSICLSVYLYIYISIYLSMYISIYIFIYLSIYLFQCICAEPREKVSDWEKNLPRTPGHQETPNQSSKVYFFRYYFKLNQGWRSESESAISMQILWT